MSNDSAPSTGPDYFREMAGEIGAAFDGKTEIEGQMVSLMAAQAAGMQAQLSMNLMLAEVIAQAAHVRHPDLEAWRKVIPAAPPEECWSRHERRPECAERHTEDCAYADPPPEPEHELLPVGTYVLISERWWKDGWFQDKNPFAAKIVGYDMHKSKYQYVQEFRRGEFYTHVQWAFADNRVQVHPDGPECPPSPEQVKQAPTGPRIYVHNMRGKSGHVVAIRREEGVEEALVQWHVPGTTPVWRPWSILKITSDVARCENGQTGDECGSGENQCELCLQAEDEEGDMIEESMGLR